MKTNKSLCWGQRDVMYFSLKLIKMHLWYIMSKFVFVMYVMHVSGQSHRTMWI